MELQPATALKGTVNLPADKSISHRAALLAAIADGTTVVDNYAASEDCASTLRCIEQLGAKVEREASRVTITGRGREGLIAPHAPLDCGNSGTTMRLIAGILAGHEFVSTLVGDDSLQSRPMRRIMEPLGAMGVAIESHDGTPPLTIYGRRPLNAVHYQMPLSSAQVKSCVLLAGLFADGETSVTEYVATRDHTERMLAWFGVNVLERQGDGGTMLSLSGPATLTGHDITVPNDISAAAFFLVGAACLPGSDLTLPNVGLNPTRRAIVDLLLGLGVDIEITDERNSCNEPSGTLRVRGGLGQPPRPLIIHGERTAALIDEVPILAVLGTQLDGGLEVRDAAELRVKESDRIATMAENLRKLGARIDEFDDGFKVHRSELKSGTVDSFGDHRIAMAMGIGGLFTDQGVGIAGAECAAVSFPGFFETMREVAQ
ncbi:MAG TPA: 3-phosphoshikimate 1-carboxyvinyltransferase [Pyrinomonadaceae bacterium]|nr:3-phosphoshikimate 1-carboxyvinyltransferase [Pyrinomonadaceae bacterium]